MVFIWLFLVINLTVFFIKNLSYIADVDTIIEV